MDQTKWNQHLQLSNDRSMLTLVTVARSTWVSLDTIDSFVEALHAAGDGDSVVVGVVPAGKSQRCQRQKKRTEDGIANTYRGHWREENEPGQEKSYHEGEDG